MKRLFIIMIVGLIMGSQAIAQKKTVAKKTTQKRESCIPYNFSRTIEEFRSEILYGRDPFIWKELWPEYARLVNRGLRSSKDSALRAKVLGNDQSSMEYIMAHSFEYDSSFANWRDFRNGTNVNDNLEYTNLRGMPSHWVGFKDKDVEIIYAKLACANPEDEKNPPQPYIPPPPKEEPKKGPSLKEEEEEEEEEVEIVKQNPRYVSQSNEVASVEKNEKRTVVNVGVVFRIIGGGSSFQQSTKKKRKPYVGNNPVRKPNVGNNPPRRPFIGSNPL